MEIVVVLLIILAVVGLIGLPSSLRVVKQYERGVIYRFGRVSALPKQPGLRVLVPFMDKMTKVNMQVVTMPVPSQEGITRNVSVRVDAVLYFRVVDPIGPPWTCRTTSSRCCRWRRPRCVPSSGKSELDALLSGRREAARGPGADAVHPGHRWGVHIDRSRSRTWRCRSP